MPIDRNKPLKQDQHYVITAAAAGALSLEQASALLDAPIEDTRAAVADYSQRGRNLWKAFAKSAFGLEDLRDEARIVDASEASYPVRATTHLLGHMGVENGAYEATRNYLKMVQEHYPDEGIPFVMLVNDGLTQGFLKRTQTDARTDERGEPEGHGAHDDPGEGSEVEDGPNPGA